MQIDIYSDVVCPWCYVGKRRLEQALTSVGRDVHVTWRPFQLNPTMPLTAWIGLPIWTRSLAA